MKNIMTMWLVLSFAIMIFVGYHTSNLGLVFFCFVMMIPVPGMFFGIIVDSFSGNPFGTVPKWHRWFAWRPVMVDRDLRVLGKPIIWLEWVERGRAHELRRHNLSEYRWRHRRAGNRDPEGRLHSENGPAIMKGNTPIYVWHGVRIPHWWIDNKESLTPDIALSESNTELRRAACSIIGWDKMLDRSDAKTIDKDEDPEIGELLETNIAGRSERLLRVRCGTGRTFTLPVPPETKTALEANAWTYGIGENTLKTKEYRT